MYKSFAVFSGILIAFMITFNGLLSNYTGGYLALIIIHVVGLIILIPILLFKRQKLSSLKYIPIYLFGAGAIGIFMVFFTNISFSFLGVSLTVSLGILGQSIASCIIDHYGLLGMEISKFQKEKLFGFVLVFIGIIIMVIY